MMSPSLPDDASRQEPDDPVEALVSQYLAQLRAGENPDRQALLRAHADLEPQLERRLAFVEMVYRVGLVPRDERTSLAETISFIDSSARESAGEGPTEAAGAAGEPGCPRPRSLAPRTFRDYELLGEIGHGGMGIVYKARQISLNRVVALKMIPAGALASAQLRARFHVEAEALASLQHPNIVGVYEVGEYDRCPYLAMEFVDGGSLDDYLARRPQPPRAAAGLVQTVSRAMHCAHQRGIIHRDLKPANILLQKSEVRSQRSEASTLSASDRCPLTSDLCPKITDFGLAKRLAEDKGQTSTGAILGTPSYMAPEQASGRVHEVGPATDTYALGALLYEMITGQPPFRGKTGMDTLARVTSEEPVAPSRLCRGLPRDLETICLKCLAKEPAKRYATAEALADDLRRFLAGEPITARPVGRAERVWKWAKRRPALAALAGVILVAVGLLAGTVTWSYTRVLDERDRARNSLQVAQSAVDDLYTKMATERLFDEPRLDPLCQELLEKARTLYEDLAREHSDNPDVRRGIGLAWFRLGEIHRLRDQHGEAERAYNEAIIRQEALDRDYPRQPRYRQDLANSHNWLGELLRERGRPPQEPERHYRVALELQLGLVAEFPSETTYRMELARSHYNLSIVEKITSQLMEAQADCDRAVELLSILNQEMGGTDTPVCAPVRQDLARALINRGVLHGLGGRPKEAEPDYDKAISLLAGLHNEFPARAAYKFELAIAWQDRANLLWRQRRHGDARRQQQEALDLFAGLVADYSTRPRYKKKMGNALKNLGAVLASVGDQPGAEQYLNRARTLFETLARDYPGMADYHGLLGMTLGNLGWLRTEQKNWPEARRLIERGIVQMRSALEPNAKNPDYLNELESQYRDLAETLVQLGDHGGAFHAATGLADVFQERAQDSYYAACFVARCVPLALADEKIGDAGTRQAVASRYVEAAVKLLKQATTNASPKLTRLPEEKQYFQVLEGHPDFSRVLRELNARVQKQQPPKQK
jgi:tetratricopeptide (TPR) repeat protein